MIVFLNREARDRFMLSEEDYALLKEEEKDAKGKDEKTVAGDKKKSDKKSDAEKGKDGVKPVTVELQDIESRIMRLTPYSSQLSDAIITADGETLLYQNFKWRVIGKDN